MTPSDIYILQPRAWSILSRSFASQRIAGTYLIEGNRGTGRWFLAVTLAQLLNCETPLDASPSERIQLPCGTCRSCRLIGSMNFPGLYVALPVEKHKNLDHAHELISELLQRKRDDPFADINSPGATSIPIDVARAIKKDLSRRAADDITRVVIFHEMDKMRADSADALLKLIEEPPPRTTIILTVERAHNLLPTIQSRSQKIKLNRIASTVIEQLLRDHYHIPPESAQLYSRIADGSLGRAMALSAHDSPELEHRHTYAGLFSTLILASPSQAISRIGECLTQRDRTAADELLRLWQSLLRDCGTWATLADDTMITNIDYLDDIKRLAGHFTDQQQLVHMSQTIKNTLADLKLNVHIQGALAALALRMSQLLPQQAEGR
jgi:DNA polymerase III gamma/tau subunit